MIRGEAISAVEYQRHQKFSLYKQMQATYFRCGTDLDNVLRIGKTILSTFWFSLGSLLSLVNVWNLIVNFTLFVKKLQSTRHLRYVLREFVCKMFRNYYALAAPDVP